MNEYVIESFIDRCDELMIANEGFGSKIVSAMRWVWEKFIGLFRKLKQKIKEFFSKGPSKKELTANNEDLKKQISDKDKEIEHLKAEMEKKNRELARMTSNEFAAAKKMGEMQGKIDASRMTDAANNNIIKKLKAEKDKIAEELQQANAEKSTLEKKLEHYEQKSSEYANNASDAEASRNLQRMTMLYRSAINQLSNAVKFGIEKHVEHVSYVVKDMYDETSVDEYTKYMNSDYERKNVMQSWLALPNSRPGHHLNEAKDDLKECAELKENTKLGYDNMQLLRAFVTQASADLDKISARVHKYEPIIEQLSAKASSAKNEQIRNALTRGVNGCASDWTEIMAVVTKAANVGLNLQQFSN